MNAVPPLMTPGEHSLPPLGQAGASEASTKWAAVHDAAEVIAMLAGAEPERASLEIADFPALMREAPRGRRELAERAVDDLAAVMEPGIAAILGVTARGADPRNAALALWHEFTSARAAVLALLADSWATGTRRSA